MRQTKLFTKTRKETPSDEISNNAKLLLRAGYIFKEMAGVYTLLPLGWRVFKKIEDIIRQEMNAVGSQEIFMTVLQEKDVWKKTNRWDDEVVDNWFKTELKNGKALGLGFTHEEAITRIAAQYVNSYKDLPFSVYQIQTKFRNEARAKSGMMRMREFSMKDMYSFSKNKEEHDDFYETMKGVYMRVFERLGMESETYITISSGGTFSKYSFEFQTLSDAGEDLIYILDQKKKLAVNKEDFNDQVIQDFNLHIDTNSLQGYKSIEVGDIYSLGYKYSEAFGLKYKDEDGKEHYVYMGSYGMSPSRLMGSIAELNYDQDGIIWPEAVSPFQYHLISLCKESDEILLADKFYNQLIRAGVEVLYDDRQNASVGEKFADSDLIGITNRLVVSGKTLQKNSVELKPRNKNESQLVEIKKFLKNIEADSVDII